MRILVCVLALCKAILCHRPLQLPGWCADQLLHQQYKPDVLGHLDKSQRHTFATELLMTSCAL